MSDRNRTGFTPDYGDYAPEAGLTGPERLAQQSRQKVSDALGDALREALRQYQSAPEKPREEPETPVSGDDDAVPEDYEAPEDYDNAAAPEEPEDEPADEDGYETDERPRREQAAPAGRGPGLPLDDIVTLDVDLPWDNLSDRRTAHTAHTARPATFEELLRREAEATGVFPAYRDEPETPRAPRSAPAGQEPETETEPDWEQEQEQEPEPERKPARTARRPEAGESPRPRRDTPPADHARPRRTLLQFLADTDEPIDRDMPDTPDMPDEPEEYYDEPDEASDEDRSPEQPGAFHLEQLLQPIIRRIATLAARREQRRAEAAKWPDPEEEPETPELPPKKAGKFYAQQLRPLRFRCRVCLFLCAALAWISLQLPMLGALGQSTSVQAGVCLILTLSVMIAALDVVANGIRQLFELRPGAESLAVLGAVFSCIDALVTMLGYGDSLPFCAVGAFSLSAALWGERRYCLAQTQTLRAASYSRATSVVVGQSGEQPCLIRSQDGPEGIVRRSEQPDLCQRAYTLAAPALLAASLLLSILASLSDGSRFLHSLSAMLSVSASFTAFLSFPLPYSVTAKRLQSSGAAIAGYAGCESIGKTRRLVIMDEDLFPTGTVKLELINIQEGTFVPNVISSTYSLLEASGSGLTGIFQELMERRGYVRLPIEEFQCHEGGGLSGLVRGERVLVGSASFMNLMGIRLPQNMSVKNTICTAFGQELVAVFVLDYTPTSSVQEALVTLLQGRTQPVFAIRDFNITPLMIRQLFRMPTDNFNFPSFRERYRLASAADREGCPMAAIVYRAGMGPMVDAVEAGRRLYNTCRIGTILSLLGSITGMLVMFLLFRAGSFDTATAGNVLSYMVLWAMPVVILSFGQGR